MYLITQQYIYICTCRTINITHEQGRKSWGDGGDIPPPCFDMGGITCLLSPPHVLTLKCVVFLFWEINNVL